MNQKRKRHSERGAALIFALMALSIFVVLGTAYLRDTLIANDAAGVTVNEARARLLAEAGVRAAIGELGEAQKAGQVRQVLGSSMLNLPTYAGAWNGSEVELSARSDRSATATYAISDENARVNINHAPPSVLQALLGVDGATARKIGASARAEKLIHPADLLTRGLLSPEQFAAINLDHLTTYTVLGSGAAKDFINVNAAPPEVLAAIADVPVETAARADQLGLRPFNSIGSFAAAMAKDAETFNLKPDRIEPGTFPSALTTESRCFRIQSEGVVAKFGPDGEPHQQTRATVEAVVLFKDASNYDVVYWSGQRAD